MQYLGQVLARVILHCTILQVCCATEDVHVGVIHGIHSRRDAVGALSGEMPIFSEMIKLEYK